MSKKTALEKKAAIIDSAQSIGDTLAELDESDYAEVLKLAKEHANELRVINAEEAAEEARDRAEREKED